MDRKQIIELLKQYFNINELVCDHIYNTFGEKAWMFLSTLLLHTILVLRTLILNLPMVVNTTKLKQRGMRCNMCSLVKSKTRPYISAHVTGNAIDFTCNTKTAEEIRLIIKDNKNKLPYNIRLEDGVTWCHIDVYDTNDDIITMFLG